MKDVHAFADIRAEQETYDPLAPAFISLGKQNVDDLAHFGGESLFASVKPTGQLAQPDKTQFYHYLQRIHENRRCTNNGPIVRELEQRLMKIHQVEHCIAFANASLALVIAMQILAPEPGEVVMPSFTYVGLPHLAKWAGHQPVFCDIDPSTHAIDPESVQSVLRKETALVLAVNNVTSPCDMYHLQELTEAQGVPLLFDSVYGLGCTYKGIPLGCFGRAEVFSLHATKLINGFEGGYVTTNDELLASGLRVARSFGFSCRDTVISLGMNAKMNEVHAASALCVLNTMDSIIERNKCRYNAYRRYFAGINGVSFLPYDTSERNNYELCLMKLDDDWPFTRKETLQLIRAENVFARPYYSPPLHTLPEHSPGPTQSPLPVTNYLTERYVQMPVGELVNEEDIKKMAILLEFLQGNRDAIVKRLRREQLS